MPLLDRSTVVLCETGDDVVKNVGAIGVVNRRAEPVWRRLVRDLKGVADVSLNGFGLASLTKPDRDLLLQIGQSDDIKPVPVIALHDRDKVIVESAIKRQGQTDLPCCGPRI